jgi:hypothetical protein
MTFRDPRFIIAFSIIVMFAAAYINNPDDTMKGALIAAFAGAWGFYLGSSSGASSSREQTGKALDLAAALAPTPIAPTLTVQPGDTVAVKGAEQS